jgi:hypothetical protein
MEDYAFEKINSVDRADVVCFVIAAAIVGVSIWDLFK